MANKLTDITTTFHSFAKSQVLTHTQLNEFLDYFDEQDRLSRVCLSGVGIVCGFDLTVDQINSTVSISQGAGVTTDGDLIHLVKDKLDEQGNVIGKVLAESLEFTHSRKYTGNTSKYHPHFNKDKSLEKFDIIPLDELIPASEAGSNDTKLTTTFLNDKVALLYLESYSTEPDSCLQIDCNNQGIEEVSKLRVLLVDLKSVQHIIDADSLFNNYAATRSLLESKPVHVPRVILNGSNTKNIDDLAEEYQNGKAMAACVSNLIKGIETIYLSLDLKDDLNEFSRSIAGVFDWRKTRFYSFQYRYDLLKDLADSYNELKDVFLENYHSCCPDITAFPKHLLLGKITIDEEFTKPVEKKINVNIGVLIDSVIEPDSDSETIDYRHKFHKSPILLDAQSDNQRFESILKRIVDQVSAIHSEVLNSHKKETVNITPSNARVPLGKRAIPFYYNYSSNLIKNWDFDKQGYGRYNSILGYRLAERYANTNNYPVVTNPFDYSIDPYNFYRIEGHQGQLYDDAFQQLTDLKEKYSLPFDIKVLGIGLSQFDDLMEEQYKCDFKDLGILLKAWSDEQICISKEVTSVLSSFSTETLGENSKSEDYFSFKDAVNPPDQTETPSTGGGPSKVDSPIFGAMTRGDDLKAILDKLDDDEPLRISKGDFETHIGTITDPVLADKANKDLKDLLDASDELEAISFKEKLITVIDDTILDVQKADKAKGDLDVMFKAKLDKDLAENAKEEFKNFLLDSEELDSFKEDRTKGGNGAVGIGNTEAAHSILNTISVLPNTLGYYINKAIANTDGQYANVLFQSRDAIEEVVSNRTNKLLYQGTVKLPTQLVIAIMSLIDLRPTSVKQLTDAKLKAYNDKLALICNDLKEMQGIYQRVQEQESPQISVNVRTMVSMVLDQLTSICCSSQKLRTLLEEVESRKVDILNRLDFSNFVKDNPGLEHKAGVEPGQTFVMVYLNTQKKWNVESSETLIGGLTRSKELLTSAADGVKSLTGDEDLKAIGARRPQFDFNLIEKGTIIADFTLPYLCCSDCAPINFVLPDIPVSLIISSETYCIDDKNLVLDLKVSPKDGVVTVVDEIPGVIIKDGKLRIDEGSFPADKLGTVLKFRVNEEDTDAELLVSNKPKVEFEFPAPGSNRIVKFTVKGDDENAYTYSWDFGNGRTSENKNPIHDFTELVSSDFPQRSDYDITLTVTSVGGICPTILSDSISFDSIKVSITDSVCINAGLVPFNIEPEGAFANIEGPGLNANKTHFDPQKTGSGTHKFTFEGKDMLVTVNDVVKVEGEIKGKRKEDNWVFYLEAQNETGFSWSASVPGVEKKITSDGRTLEIPVKVIDKLEAGKDEITINVTVKGCDEITQEIKWTVPGGQEPNAWLNDLEFCRSKKGSFVIQIENFKPSTKLTGIGVNNEVEPPTFTPFGLELGETHILVDDEITDTVYIVDEPVAEITKFSSNDKGLTASVRTESRLDKIDLNSVTWKFLDQDKKELMEPIKGQLTINVAFEKFTNNDWTEVTVVLIIEGGPCSDGVDEKTIEKPARVTFSLDDTVFCSTDSKKYPINFKPKQGDVKVTGAGVSKEGNEFSPWKLPAKEYTLTATNDEKFKITVVDKPTISIGEISRSESGFSTSAVLPAGTDNDSITWVFEGVGATTRELLHSTEKGSPNIDISFSDFFTQKWTQVKITLIAFIEPCGEVRTSTILDKEEPGDVEVSLSKDVYCNNDTRTYGFIYEPNEPMPMTGPGLTKSKLAFSPNGLEAREYTFTATNQQQVTINVIESSQLNEVVHNPRSQTVTLTYSPNGEDGKISGVLWKIGKGKLGGFPESSDDSYVISLKELGFEPGDILVYELNIKSEICGDKKLSGSFPIPGGNEKQCEITLLGELKAISDNAPSESEISTLKKAYADVKNIESLNSLLQSLRLEPQNVISGSMNDAITSELESLIQEIEAALQLAHDKGDETNSAILKRLYRMAVGIYGNAFRCQNPVVFDDFDNGIKLNTTLRKHFDESVSESFINKGIVVFDTPSLVPFEALLNDKGTSGEPWETIDFVIKATPKLR